MMSKRSLEYIEKEFPRDMEVIRQRLINGARDYGDTSFDRPVLELIDEVAQEIDDQIGWSLLAKQNLKALRRRVEMIMSMVPAQQ